MNAQEMVRSMRRMIAFVVFCTMTVSHAFSYDFVEQIEGKECFFNVIEKGICELTFSDVASIGGETRYNTENTGYSGRLRIPYSVEHEGVEYYIARIGDHAFQDCAELTDIDIQHGCEEIGFEAFHNCTGLATVSVGKNRTNILVDENAFDYDETHTIRCKVLAPDKDSIASASTVWSSFQSIDDLDPNAVDVPPSPSGTIPILYINTKNGAPVTSKTVYVDATCFIEGGENGIATPENPLILQIRGRGNSSWKDVKKPYKLKLAEKTSLLGMKKDRNWALINGTQWVRQMVGFELGNKVGMEWNPSSRPVEVVLNGDYIGLYLLMETVRTAKNRVDIDEQPDMCTNPDSLNGGWLVEIDNYPDTRQIIVPEGSQWQMRVTWHTPEELSTMQKDWLKQEFTQLNRDIYAAQKSDAVFAKHIHAKSMARFFIVQEVMDNPDGFHGSFFLHKHYGENTPWIAGPLWDMTCMERNKTDYTYKMKVSYAFTPHLIGEMLKYECFRDAVNREWRKFFPEKAQELMRYIDEECSPSIYSAADAANNARWPNANYQGVEAKVNRTRYWMRANIDWFNRHLPPSANAIKEIPPSEEQVAPVIYNLQGQRLQTEPNSGIYIKEGKKYVK